MTTNTFDLSGQKDKVKKWRAKPWDKTGNCPWWYLTRDPKVGNETPLAVMLLTREIFGPYTIVLTRQEALFTAKVLNNS